MAAAENVKMQMRDAFARVGADIGDDAKAAVGDAQSAGDFDRREQQSAQQQHVVIGRRRKVFERLFGDDDNVRRSLGRDVSKRQNIVVFVHHIGGNFAGKYLRKNRVGHRRQCTECDDSLSRKPGGAG